MRGRRRKRRRRRRSTRRGRRGGETGGCKSGVSLLLLQARADTELQQAEKIVLYCFRAAGNESLPETLQTAIKRKWEKSQNAAQ